MERRLWLTDRMQYVFADCVLDTARHRLLRGGVERHVEPQVFALLRHLAEHAGEIVSRDALVDAVWEGRVVSDATIDARISAARASVGDSGREQAIIRTVTRVGLRLVAPVERRDAAPSAPVAPAGGGEAQGIHMTSSADGAGIAWSALGEGPPLLRAGHWMTHLELDLESPVWRPWIERLARGRRLVRYDPRGTGMSDRSCAGISLDALVADLKAVADAAGLDRFSIFAASQSAPVACKFAALHPERVDRMVIYGGFAQGNKVRDPASGTAMTQAMGELIRQGWGKPSIGSMRCFSSLFIPVASEEQIQSFIAMQVASASPDWAVRIRETAAEFDVTGVLGQVRAPVLVAHALDDALQPFAQAQLMARLLPHATLKPIHSANHILVPDEPGFGRLMDAVDAFLARPEV